MQNYVANSRTRESSTRRRHRRGAGADAGACGWLRAESAVHPVLVAGIAQFQLVHIHPFLDGNGRTSRLLSTLCLYRTGYDFKRLFTLSEFYDRDRAASTVRSRACASTTWI